MTTGFEGLFSFDFDFCFERVLSFVAIYTSPKNLVPPNARRPF